VAYTRNGAWLGAASALPPAPLAAPLLPHLLLRNVAARVDLAGIGPINGYTPWAVRRGPGAFCAALSPTCARCAARHPHHGPDSEPWLHRSCEAVLTASALDMLERDPCAQAVALASWVPLCRRTTVDSD